MEPWLQILCVRLPVQPSVCASSHPSARPTIRLPVHPSVCASSHPSACPTICLPVQSSVCASNHPSVQPSTCALIHPSTHLSALPPIRSPIFLRVHPPVHPPSSMCARGTAQFRDIASRAGAFPVCPRCMRLQVPVSVLGAATQMGGRRCACSNGGVGAGERRL